MTREETRKAAEVMLAYADGKDLQICGQGSNEWVDVTIPVFNWELNSYRVKPEPKYRPFKNADECFEEMKKHEPFGWIKRISNNEYIYVDRITQFHIGYSQMMYVGFDLAFRKFQFPDGTPFGIKEG